MPSLRRSEKLRVAALLLNVIGSASDTFFISPSGSDTNAGTSPSAPWRTAANANARTFAPGDSVLFEAGATLALPAGLLVRPSAQIRAASDAPIVIASYGFGAPATIIVDGSKSAAVAVQELGGVVIANISVAHSGSDKPSFSGLQLASSGDGPRFAFVRVANVAAAGFLNGISIDSSGCAGFSDVVISNASATGSLGTGISSSGAYGRSCYSHSGITVEDCVAFRNPGDAENTKSWSGSGIVLSGVDGAVIQRSLAYENGYSNGHVGGGPCGIWFWDTNNGTISRCVSHSNSNGNPLVMDGCGYDLDGGSTNSAVEYSLSYNNSGPGFLLCSFGGPMRAENLTVRYSVSYGDGEKCGNGAAGVNLYTPDSLTNLSIVGNTLVSLPGAGPLVPLIAPLDAGNRASGFSVQRNALLALNGAPTVSMPANQLPSGAVFRGNAYWARSPAPPSLVEWAGKSFSTLAAFRSATGQEPAAGGGSDSDPQLSTSGAFFRSCVPWWSASETTGGFPALPNSASLDALRGFDGCG